MDPLLYIWAFREEEKYLGRLVLKPSSLQNEIAEKFLGLGTLKFGGIKASKIILSLRLLFQVPLQPGVKTAWQIFSQTTCPGTQNFVVEENPIL